MSALVPESTEARWLTLGTFASSIGFGAFTASSAIFFVRSVGLTPRDVGIGLTVAGIGGIGGSVLLGHLADSHGPRRLTMILSACQAVLLASYVLVHSFPAFLVVVSMLTVAERGSGVVRNALIASLMGRADRVRIKAYQRSVFNLGVSLGTVAAVVPLQLDSRAAYVALVLGNAVSALVVLACTWRLPGTPPVGTAGAGGRWVALRDRPYVAMSLFCGLLTVHHSVLTVGIPIWVAVHTTAPRSVVAVLFFVNTLMSVLLQVRASRGAETVAGAGIVARRGAVVLLPACLLVGLAGLTPVAPAVALLLAGGVLLTMGELWASAATWGLSFELAVPAAQGRYQGVFSLGMTAGSVVGPVLVTGLALPHGVAGWALLGGYFVLVAAAARPVAAWARSTRLPGAAALSEVRR